MQRRSNSIGISQFIKGILFHYRSFLIFYSLLFTKILHNFFCVALQDEKPQTHFLQIVVKIPNTFKHKSNFVSSELCIGIISFRQFDTKLKRHTNFTLYFSKFNFNLIQPYFSCSRCHSTSTI